jgi:hypothetical protein
VAACTQYRCSKAELPPVTCIKAPWLGFAVIADGTDGVGTAAGSSTRRRSFIAVLRAATCGINKWSATTGPFQHTQP